MSNTPSGSVSRNTRTGGPTIEEFRALESASATISERVDALGSQQRAEVGDLRDRIQAVATTQEDRFGRLESRLEAFFDQIKAKQEPSTTSGVSTESPNPATSASSGSGASAKVYTVKTEDTGTFDGTPENLELFLARVQAIRFAETDAGWDRAVLHAITLALRGRAAIWHSTLTDKQRAGLCRIDYWFEALRENFSPQSTVVRQQARDRTWDPDHEDILGFVFAKIALLKVGFRNMTEEDVVQEIADRLPVDIQMLLRQPRERQPSLVRLREELRIQEVFWRIRHNRPLLPSSAVETASPSLVTGGQRTSSFAELVVPAAHPVSAQASSDRRPFRGSVAQRRGKAYAEDFDPSLLGRGKSPRTGKENTPNYRVPGTDETIWGVSSSPHSFVRVGY
ncbi:unnamed protein product [Tilletia controversa]|nr:unnamed protein product [Tilletia controversa]